MELRKISQEELNEIVENHRHWLNRDCDGWEKMRADLSYVDLRRANLRDVDLRQAIFRCADLRGADLMGADLMGASLINADLSGANYSFNFIFTLTMS